MSKLRSSVVAVLSFASSVIAGSVFASQMYVNKLATPDATVPAGEYGSITVAGSGYKATAFSTRTAITGGSGDVNGIIKKISGDNDIQTHTVSGWFKVDALNQMIYFVQGVVSNHSGYKIWVDESGHVSVAKTFASDGSTTDGSTLTTTETITAGTWNYLTVSVSRTTFEGKSRKALVHVFVNGTECTMSSGAINSNLNGNGGCTFFIESGVSAAGLYIDTEAVTDTATIIGWATDSNIVEEMPFDPPPAPWSQHSPALVARWDFNNYDPANPTSTGILAATVGEDAMPCYYDGNGSALVTDGTIGQMYVACADASDADAVTAFNALGGGNYAIAIPQKSHIALPIPSVLLGQNHTFTIKIRCWISAMGWHAFFNRDNSTDADLFITTPMSKRNDTGIGGDVFGNNNNYKTGIGLGSWQTVTVSAGPTRHDVFLNETTQALYGNNGNNFNYFNNPTELLTTHNGKQCLLLCADNDGEDGLMYIDYVEIFSDASVYEGKAPHYTKDGLTGEWTFSGSENNNLKATVGGDATRWTRTGSSNFTIGTDGVLPGDGYLRAGRNNGIQIPHGLPSDASYTVVLDVRVPDNDVKTQTWHGLINMGTGDATLFLKWESNRINIRTCGDQTIASGLDFGEFGRIVITYQHGGTANVYVNGVLKRTVPVNKCSSYPTTKGGSFTLLGDDDGEDYDSDVSYCAIYDRILTADEIAELHSRPLAQKDDGTFVPTVPVAGLWAADADTGALVPVIGETLQATDDGGYVWTRLTAPAAATWVADLTLAAEQLNGGALVKNAANVATGIYGTGSTYNGSFSTMTNPADFTGNTTKEDWGWWSENALDRITQHRLAVTWAANGRVHYYVDGRLWGQLFPLNANKAAKPTEVMNFFSGLGATVTRLAAYDAALTPDEVSSLGGPGAEPGGDAPVVGIASSSIPAEVKSMVDEVSFTISATQAEGEKVSYMVVWGDGTASTSGEFLTSGTEQTFTHVYKTSGTFTPVFKAFSQSGAIGSISGESIAVMTSQYSVRDVLITAPWQQNVYTNRFTIMCEGVKVANDPEKWQGLEVQWGENYANRTTMTRVESNGGTWIYKAHIAAEGMDGQTIPYRLGYFGLPLTYEDPADNTEGTVKLWSQTVGESFSVGIWGDNQQGARAYDWDSDKYAYVRAIFNHMVAQGVDFGISSGDMASSADYNNQIKLGILQATDGILGKTRPYYVAWGNHDISYRNNQPFFETGSIDDPAWGTSEDGAYYLYRGNVLFIFIHQSAYNATTATWMSNLLATERAKAASFRVMIQHYPFWLECWSGNNSTALLETAKAGGVDIIFSGHMHGYERYLKDGIVQLTNGGAGYLDHVETVTTYYGDDIFLGGHKNLPYLWARQQSPTVNNVLGGAEPVRMGCIQSYGELRFENNTLHYLAHGFNADGSYIGVFDDFTLVSKTCAATTPTAPAVTPCADPSTFAEFTAKPVTNAKWAEYKTAIGETFAYDAEQANAPVVNVSKTEIEKFLAWLNGETGDYRLPTVDELATAFGGELRREVSEWTSSVDPNTGWCRILGSPAKAQEGTWARAEDTPSIATAGCHADYLGFRLATGAAPVEPVDALAAPLAALAEIAEPARAYKWENGALVDISDAFYAASGAQAYDVPVILTDADDITRENPDALVFNAGFTAPNSTAFFATGPLSVSGEVKAGQITNQWQWRFGSISNTLTLANVTYRGSGITFRAGDLTLRVKGHNDFSGAMYGFNHETQHPTNIVTAVDGEAATIKFASARNLGTFPFRVGENVTMKLAGEFRVTGSTALWVDGVLDAEAFNIQDNVDPGIYGAGTLKIGYYGSYKNSWPYFGISNLVVTTKRFWRANYPSTKSYNAILIDGDEVHISSTCDWEIPPKDQFGYNTYFVSNNRDSRAKVVFEGDYDLLFAPTYTAGRLSTTDFNNPWDIEKAGTGTLTLARSFDKPFEVSGGTVRLEDGVALTSKANRLAAGATLQLAAQSGLVRMTSEGGTLALASGVTRATLPNGSQFTGPVALAEGVEKLALDYLLPADNPMGAYEVLVDSGLKAEQIDLTCAVPDGYQSITTVSEDGDATIVVTEPGKTISEWTGAGDTSNPSDPANWQDGKVPDENAYVLLSSPVAFTLSPPAQLTMAGFLAAGKALELGADCDWRGIGEAWTAESFAGVTIDLKGRVLRLAAPNGTYSGSLTITDTTSENPGDLRMEVAEDETFTNSGLTLAGNVRLVKDGAGTFVANKDYQTYRRGNEVCAGTLRASALPERHSMGGNGINSSSAATNVVHAGATFDINNQINWGYNTFILDGGTLVRASTKVNCPITLTADSTISSRDSSSNEAVLQEAPLDLGGHVLTFKIKGGCPFYMRSTAILNGTILYDQGGWLAFDRALDAPTLDLDIRESVRVTSPITVRNYICNHPSDYNDGDELISVTGVFALAPNARKDYFHGVLMKDGSVIDLSGRTSALNVVSGFSSGAKTCTFADGATIGVKLGAKKRGKIVAWETRPDASVKFVVPKGSGCWLDVRNDGLYACQGLLMLFR